MRTGRWWLVVLALVLATGAGCETESPEASDAALDTAAVRASLDSLQRAFSRAGQEGLAPYVTEDALLAEPGGAAWDSLRSVVRGGAPGSPSVRIAGMETRILSPDWAYKLTVASVSHAPSGAADTLRGERTALMLFHRTEDGWKVHRVINSSRRLQRLGRPAPDSVDVRPDTTAAADVTASARPRSGAPEAGPRRRGR